MREITEEIDKAIEVAGHAAFREIQKALGVDDGGLASFWFTGEREEQFRGLFLAYIAAEVASMKDGE